MERKKRYRNEGQGKSVKGIAKVKQEHELCPCSCAMKECRHDEGVIDQVINKRH